jgi:hypothetical protein
VLFTGYAPVHFACFRPLFERLWPMPGVDVRVSGGSRMMTPFVVRFDHEAMYAPFQLPPGSVLPFDEAKEMDFDVLFTAHTGRIQPRSFGTSIQLFHGMSFRNMAIREENVGFDHYFLLGPYMRRGFESRGLLKPGDPAALDIGFPKTDRLLDGSLDRATIAGRLGLSGERPIVLYAPTGVKDNSLDTFGEEVIRLLLQEECYDLLVKLHDHPKGMVDWFSRLGPLENQHFRVVREPDVIPILFASDLLITDASSVANEYLLLDRPIVFLDVPALIETARRAGAMVDLETWGRRGGEVVADSASAVRAVAHGLGDPRRLSSVRREMSADLFYNPGRATDAALAWLATELNLPLG